MRPGWKGASVHRSCCENPLRRPAGRRAWRALAGAGLLAGLLAGCSGGEPEAQPAVYRAPPSATSAPAAPAYSDGDATLGDLAREADWRRRTADKLRRLP